MIVLLDGSLTATTPKNVVRVLQKWLSEQDEIDRDKEHGIVLSLNVRNKVMVMDITCIGILNASLFHPREVFRRAIAHGAARIILAHNHPSNDCSPSSEDEECTKRMAEAGTILGIEVIDHIIFSQHTYSSLSEMGLL
jgi:DNA repair protein RadC